MKISWDEAILLGAACLALIALAWQYPASTTFPIGGDAPAYITNLKTVLHHPTKIFGVLTNTWYPAMYAWLLPATALPIIDWPTRFTWWMAIGQIFTGLMVGWLCYRLGGLKSAAFGIALWALTPIVLTPFYEDGTLAQLWSLPFILLFFERFFANSPRGVIIALLLVLATHPISGLVLIASLLIATPSLMALRTKQSGQAQPMISLLVLLSAISTGLFLIVLTTRYQVLSVPFHPESSPYTRELIFGSFTAWTMLAVLGYAALTHKLRNQPAHIIVFGSFVFLSVLLAFNDQLGIGFWTRRLTCYLLLAIIIACAYILPRLLNKIITYPAISTAAALALFGALSISVWHENDGRYNHYQSPRNYGRLLVNERAAITWLQLYLPPGATVYSSTANRNTEWIAALTNVNWIPVDKDPIQNILASKIFQNSYAIYLTHQEEVPAEYKKDTAHYRVIYHNDSAYIIQVL